ncbi:MAG: tail fiber domain-containing protein [Ferruginibacter sp.]
MKKLIGLLAITLITINAHAQGIGIGTATPKAAFNVAENKTVLFGRDTSGGGGKMMWIPSKYAFRAGVVGTLISYSATTQDSSIWDADSIGKFSFASGHQNKAKNVGTTAMGVYNQAVGSYSTTLGFNNRGYDFANFAAGSDNVTSGFFSLALGSTNTSQGSYATAIGHYNQAGSGSAAIGVDNRVGNYSYAFGNSNINNAEYCTTVGYNNNTNSYQSIVLGVNNDTLVGSNATQWISTDPIFTIGNGRGGGSRSNAMMILKNGKTGFGTNTPTGLLHIKHNSQAANPQLVLEEAQNDYSRISFKNANPGYWNIEAYTKPILGNNDVAKLNFYYSAKGYIFSLSGNGNATLTGTLFQNSDERLKKNITPLKNTLSKISQLNAYTYQWKDTARGNEEQLGLLAQEVEKQFPQLVMTDEHGKKSVAYANMVPVLLQAAKEQQQQIDELKKLVEAKLK